MQSRVLPSFFFTNNTGAPHENTLGLIKFLSSNSPNWDFNFDNSDANIRYGAIYVGIVLGIKSMANSNSLFGGSSEISFGNTFGNSHTTDNSVIDVFP